MVCDTGPGIPAAKHRIIFREFERLGENAGKEPGLGLGLAIVERLSRMLGCPLTMTSKPDRGTAFSITVPVAQGSAKEAVAARPDRKKTAPSRPDLTGSKSAAVLVIDNEPAILDGMTRLLRGWGCTVLTAATGAEAAAALSNAQEPPQVIIADYHLDDEDGLEIIEMLRAMAGRPLSAILITADRSSETQAKARGHDVICLHKPVKPAALRALMNRICPARAQGAGN